MVALGIGANTAVFSVIKAVLLNPLPYRESDRLARIWETLPGMPQINVSWPDYLDWKERARVFEDIALFSPFSTMTLTGQELPEQVTVGPAPDYRPTSWWSLRIARCDRSEFVAPVMSVARSADSITSSEHTEPHFDCGLLDDREHGERRDVRPHEEPGAPEQHRRPERAPRSHPLAPRRAQPRSQGHERSRHQHHRECVELRVTGSATHSRQVVSRVSSSPFLRP